MVEVIWTYRVREKYLADFERYYRADGVWAQFFRAADGYRGTILLRDRENKRRFATVDRWETLDSYERFLREHQAEYAKIDMVCAAWTTEETRVGCFEICDSA